MLVLSMMRVPLMTRVLLMTRMLVQQVLGPARELVERQL